MGVRLSTLILVVAIGVGINVLVRLVPQIYLPPERLTALHGDSHSGDIFGPQSLYDPANPEAPWTPAGIALLESLWIGSLPPLPPDPSNDFANRPSAAQLGQKIFFDNRFSVNGKVSCATCHQPERLFTDGRAQALGLGELPRNTPSIAGTAYGPWLFWDGRKDSQWSQALAPLENPLEHGLTRTGCAHLIASDPDQRNRYENLFGPLPDLADAGRFPPFAGPQAPPASRQAWQHMAQEDREAVNRVFANIGKALAAYQRPVRPSPSRFDRYVEAVRIRDRQAMDGILNRDELAGLLLFIGKGECINCHSGPLFSNHAFHNTGVPVLRGLEADRGRADAVADLFADPFNCLGPYSDAEPEQCAELLFVRTKGQQLVGAFKSPSFRNAALTAPFMHAGQFATLGEVLRHYNRAEPAPVGVTELSPLYLSQTKLAQLEAFLRTLNSPLQIPP